MICRRFAAASIVFGAVFLFTVGTSRAEAQAPQPISISLGALLPSDKDTRHRTGSALFMGAVRYALPAKPSAQKLTVLEASAATSSRAYEGSGIYSGTVGEVFSLRSGRSPLSGQTAYVGVGAGLYGMDLRFIHAFARVGGYAEAGYNLSRALFVNAQYRFADRGDGASVTLGTRF